MSVSLFVPGRFSIALTMLSGFKRHGSSDQGTAWWPSYATDFKPHGPLVLQQGDRQEAQDGQEAPKGLCDREHMADCG